MLSWAITFLIIAIIAAVLGFGGIAGTACPHYIIVRDERKRTDVLAPPPLDQIFVRVPCVIAEGRSKISKGLKCHNIPPLGHNSFPM